MPGLPSAAYYPQTRYLLYLRDWNRPETGLCCEIYERAVRGSNASYLWPRGMAPLAGVRVLLASDNGSDRSLVVSLLRDTRYLVVQAGSVRESARILSHIVFPVILYDASCDVAERSIF